MKRISCLVVALIMMSIASAGLALRARAVRATDDEATKSVTGYVIDSACMYVKKLEKPIGTDCARQCALAGSPLVILADDGTVYLPISAEMPAKGQNDRLMEFAGERVNVTGRVFVRGGSHAMVIDTIGKAPAAPGH